MDKHSQGGSAAPPDTITAFVHQPGAVPREVPPGLWGFGGLHGGLALAALTAQMAETAAAPDVRGQATDTPHAHGQNAAAPLRLRSVTGRFHRAVRDPFTIDTQVDARTRSTVSVGSTLRAAVNTAATGADPTDSPPLVSATALYGSSSLAAAPSHGPERPAVPHWSDATLFRPPPSFVPVSERYELRVTGENRPFNGGTNPRLTAWLRLREDDRAPDDLRLLFIADALAPSISAVLHTPQPVPTLELRAAFSGHRAVSPWVLVDARTMLAGADGWVTEDITVWGEDGACLLEATQLRLVRPA